MTIKEALRTKQQAEFIPLNEAEVDELELRSRIAELADMLRERALRGIWTSLTSITDPDPVYSHYQRVLYTQKFSDWMCNFVVINYCVEWLTTWITQSQKNITKNSVWIFFDRSIDFFRKDLSFLWVFVVCPHDSTEESIWTMEKNSISCTQKQKKLQESKEKNVVTVFRPTLYLLQTPWMGKWWQFRKLLWKFIVKTIGSFAFVIFTRFTIVMKFQK